MIRCIVIDDEPLARKGLAGYVCDIDFLQLVGEYDNPLSIGDAKADLYFLDIEMPKMTGIEFFKAMNPAPMVVFTTAYPQYAVDGFDMNAVDYLLKPISFDRFYKAATKARDLVEMRQANIQGLPPASHNYFFVKADNSLVKIMLDDILFIEAVQNYISIHTRTRKYLAYLTFHGIGEWLPSDRFIKTHKSFIVSAEKIDRIEGNDIHIGDQLVPISRNLKDEVMDMLLKGRFLKR